MSEAFSLSELSGVDGFKYEEIDAYGGKLLIGTVSALDMLEWLEGNEEDQTPAAKRLAGLRLVVKAVADGKTKERIPEGEREKWVQTFMKKDGQENAKVIRAVLRLNGLGKVAKAAEEAARKNDSSEAPVDASPGASPSPSVS